MQKYSLWIIVTSILLLGACTPTPEATMTPSATKIKLATRTPTRIKSKTPSPSTTPTVPTATATMAPTIPDRPVFLNWPLPAYIGTDQIVYYPNTPWTWNFLGLNQGSQCPPENASMTDLDLYQFWRDTFIPLAEDMAQADPHQFGLVECYASDDEPGRNGHAGTDIKAPAGTPVLAAAEGRLFKWRDDKENSMIVLKHCLGGEWNTREQCESGVQWYTTYLHIILADGQLKENRRVVQGAELGKIYQQGEQSHLHFEVGKDTRSYDNFVNPWGSDHSPWYGCMWVDPDLCAQANPDDQLTAIYTNGDSLVLQQGWRDPLVIPATDQIQKLQFQGNTMCYLKNGQNLFCRNLTINNSEWEEVAQDILDFQVTNTRIGILDKNSYLFVKPNDWRTEWVLVKENVKAFSISDHRIGVTDIEGILWVKSEYEGNDWEKVAEGVRQFQVLNNRIAYIDSTGMLMVNEGPLSAKCKPLLSGVRVFQLTMDRVGAINSDGVFLVKEGGLQADWVEIKKDVVDFQLINHRILTLDTSDVYHLKENNLFAEWEPLPFSWPNKVWMNGTGSIKADEIN